MKGLTPQTFLQDRFQVLQGIDEQGGTGRLLDTLEGIARNAGKAVFQIFQNLGQVTTRLKSDRSPVSNADILSNVLILEGLKSLDPTIPVISEETIIEGTRKTVGQGPIWLVDPLDGTKEFLNGIGEFAINIALVVEGSPVLGVIHIPATEQTFCAVKGQGAFVRERETSRKLSPNLPPSRPYTVLTSRYHTPVTHMDSELFTIVPCGSSVKFCRLAESSAQIYPRFAPTKEWDTAAGHILVEETGGAIVDLEGHPLTYDKPSLYNPHFLAVSHSSLLKNGLLREILSFQGNGR